MERTYFQPANLEEALALLDQHPDAAVVAGGTDIVVADRSGKKSLPATLIAIHRVQELQSIGPSSTGGLRIGALVTHGELEDSGALRVGWQTLADASALVGSPATRSAGTIGGNVCNASPAMEVGSPLLVSEATVELASSSGTRTLPYADFVSGPAQTTRRPNELLTAVILPALPGGGRVSSAYVRLEYRQAMEIAIVGAAALIVLDADGRCAQARIALTAVAPTCVRVPAAETILQGQGLSSERLQQAADAAAAAAKPIDDVRGSAEYRRAMVPVIVRQALELAISRSAPVAVASVPA
jgi:CO/xanthine dehydrogenase FAD-binding subunit